MRVAAVLDAPQYGREQEIDGPGQFGETARLISREYAPGIGAAAAGARRRAGGSAVRNAGVLAEERHDVGSAGQVGAGLEREPVDCAWVKSTGHHGVLEGRWGATTR
jgi:hypothetical protein